MANPTAALNANVNGPYPAGPPGMLTELITITGSSSAVGATVSYVMQFVSDPQIISPGYSMTVSKSGLVTTVTITLEHAIASTDIENIEISGFIG
jgi:hypothetical protein